MKYLIIISFNLLFALFNSGYSQQSDSVFTYNQFIEIVKEHHPIAFQASLKEKEGDAYLLKAKGGFDPKLSSDFRSKEYSGDQYYSYFNSNLKVPTWFGLQVEGGYDNNDGYRLNNESYTPSSGLWYAGISANIGRGLFIDERRAELKQARLVRGSTLLEQKMILNQLIYDASIAYWECSKAFNKMQIYTEAVESAEQRFEGVYKSALFGDKPFVDTLKARIQVQERELKLEQSRLEFQNKTAYLNVFLWQDGFIPLELDSIVLFQNLNKIDSSIPSINIDSVVYAHPEYALTENDLEISKIDFRLKKEALKPELKLKYNALTEVDGQNYATNFSPNNYTFGVQFSYPIFSRKLRGENKLAKVKLDEQESKLMFKFQVLKYKILASQNSFLSTEDQLNIYASSLTNYEELYNSELQLFDIGESSLFLLNVRDLALMDAKVKYLDLAFQIKQAESKFYNSIVLFNYE